MSIIGLVPMKGHSERVPGKNLKPLAGRPLFHWVLETLGRAGAIDHTVVDTDSPDIASAVNDSFPTVEIVMRPDDLHGDYVSMHRIVAHVARHFADDDHILQTHATNPLLSSETVDDAVEAYLRDGQHDSLMSVTARQARFYRTDGSPVNHDPGDLLRTQDLSPLLEENSNVYIAPVEQIRRLERRIGDHPLLFPMSAEESLDIDEPLDFDIADFLLQRRSGGS